MGIDDEKRLAAEAAADLVEDGMRSGLGTGTTVAHFLPGAGRARGSTSVCVATSLYRRSTRARSRLAASSRSTRSTGSTWPSTVPTRSRRTAGSSRAAGAAQTREKIVAAAADRFVVIVSSDKLVSTDSQPPVPLELMAFGLQATLLAIGDAVLRDVPPSPDGGLLADYVGRGRRARRRWRRRSTPSPGVLDHGLFSPSLVSEILVGTAEGVERRTP